MLITAHGGAHDTSRNSKRFFSDIANYNVDVVEVDIWKCGKRLYLSHLPAIPFFRLSLSYAFRFIKEHNFKINCDVKQSGIVRDVLALAEKEGVSDRIIFTGSVAPGDIKYLSAGNVYLNKTFFNLARPAPSDVKAMAEYMRSFNCPRIMGINLRHTFLSEEFLSECVRYNLTVSTFVVNEDKEMDRLLKHKNIVNITSNYPEKVLEKLQLQIKK